jgi:hypothetical protein
MVSCEVVEPLVFVLLAIKFFCLLRGKLLSIISAVIKTLAHTILTNQVAV